MKTEKFPKPNIGFIEELKEIDKNILDAEIEISILKESNIYEVDGIDFAKKSADRMTRITELIDIIDELKKQKDNLLKSNSN